MEKCDFKNFDELKIDTVDAFQGENVAISRAKENLIFVGKKSFFENLRSDEKNIFSAILQVCR
ncbi:helicase [Helicobacter pylori NQ4228]|nr:helicase [Helicobacter pylori NQ4228]